MKTLLALETSTAFLSVALGDAKGRVFELASKSPFKHSENLVPFIDRLLRRSGVSLGEIEVFAIDRGPGSFTGLRIGFSLVKGFLVVTKRPCYGALSLDMMAAKVSTVQHSRLGVVVDARRGRIYTRFYRAEKGEWVGERRPELLSSSELHTRINPKTLLVGESLDRYKTGLKVRAVTPSARTLVQWFREKNPRLLSLTSPRDLLPLYFRTSEAEEKGRAPGALKK